VSLNIGNVLKAMDDGKWEKVPAPSGEFWLKLKPFLPGEQYALQAKIKAADGELAMVGTETVASVAAHIVGWRDLLQANGEPLAFNPDLLKDEKFLGALLGLQVEIPVGERKVKIYLLNWIVNRINKSDSFTEDTDTSFLAPI